ncbi:chain-length determining protein [Prevotella communis]|uniref:chain-length determining protein n=1 Tax=Prevotella communis TaxID=2913614 RepID=UPI001EDA6916|nr:chain-length determining protein [Prevotella communis]UKK60218.1 chain-length determining protein [Prevotella communis]UKK62952.1 chain-length determining protein [Prevotella communis]UKK65777.1 chain-length determining protein [Prevotella communis]
MEDNKKELKTIDVINIAKKLWARKKLFAKTLPIAFVLSCVFILGFPRYYNTDIKLAPELGGSSIGSSTLGSLASSFGFDLDNLQSNDAITPLLYPDLMEDNGFVTNLFNVRVKTVDGSIETTYHDYLQKHQKPVIWFVPIDWMKNLFRSKQKAEERTIDPYNLSKDEDAIAGSIRNNIKINFDKKTAVISISIKDQDPLICKTIGDSVKERLQEFITDYRTSKARTDYEYYMKLTMEAKQEYEKTRQQYGRMADASTNVALKSLELQLEDMENDLQLRYNTYTTLNTQMQASKAKVQERTPAFTVIKGASVPIKPAGPKRMIFVAFMLMLTFAGTSLYILRKQ